MVIEPWAAPLVTGTAIVFLGVTGAMGVWYSLRIAWWILRALGRGATWLADSVVMFAQDMVGELGRIVESARPASWGRSVDARLERLRAEAEARRPREVGVLTSSIARRPLSESWTQIDWEARVPPARDPYLPVATDRARRRWIVAHARARGGRRGSIGEAAEVWEYMRARGMRAPSDEITAADWYPQCDCEPDEYETRTFDGSQITVSIVHEPHCATQCDIADAALAEMAEGLRHLAASARVNVT